MTTLSPARRRVLRAVAELGASEPVTLHAVAERLGGHPNTSRQQLDALVASGLLAAITLPTHGPGRPPRGYRVTASGRAALGTFEPASEYRELVGAFATYLVGRPAEDAREVGRVWGEAKADAIGAVAQEAEPSSLLPSRPGAARPSAPAQLIELLDTLGFDPAPIATDAGRHGVVLRACPLLDTAGDHPEVMCELHRGMVDGVMRRLGASDGVTLEPFADPDGCRLTTPT